MNHEHQSTRSSGFLRQWALAGTACALGLIFSGLATAAQHAPERVAVDQSKTIVYAALGEELARYELDAKAATLTKLGVLKLPANLQFAEFHPCRCLLYAVSSNAGSGTLGAKGDKHLLSAYSIDPKTGALTPHGESIPLPERPIHMTIDRKGAYALVAFNQSGTVKSYRIDRNGVLGEEVIQSTTPDGGIFTHQVVVTPSNKTAIALGRGNDAVAGRPSEIGSYSLFDFKEGQLDLARKVPYEEGIGPRHLAFHPSKPWVYVAIERTSKLFMYDLKDGSDLSIKPVFRTETLQDRQHEHRDRQKGGVVRIHPNGKFAYVTNRADGTVKKEGKTVWAGGENTLAVFALDGKTGDPLARRAFWRRITTLAAEGTTIIVTTHFMEEAEYCDRIVIQDAGRLLALGTPHEVRDQAAGAENMNDAFLTIIEKSRMSRTASVAAVEA